MVCGAPGCNRGDLPMTGFTMFLIFPEVWKGGLPVPIDTHIVYCKANACTHVLYTFLLSRFQPVKRLAVSVGFALRKVDQTTSGTAVSSTHFSLCASFRIIPNKFIATSSAILLHVCAQKWHTYIFCHPSTCRVVSPHIV